MNKFFNEFRIPTLLGLSVILFGIAVGVYLTLQSQTSFVKASPNFQPKDVKVTNIEDKSATISWQTSTPTTSFVTFGQGGLGEQVVLDDRDQTSPQKRRLHHVTLKNLAPATTYLFKISSGKFTSATLKFTTAPQAFSPNGLEPIFGSVIEGNTALGGGLIFLTNSLITPQSAVIKNFGTFLIPLNMTRSADLSRILTPESEANFKLEVITEDDRRGSATFNLKNLKTPIGPLKIGQDLDLKLPVATTAALVFDLNQDGLINASDHAIILNNLGKNPKEKRADLNSDGVVDKKDLGLILKEIEKRGLNF